jgi:TPR repeat protein
MGWIDRLRAKSDTGGDVAAQMAAAYDASARGDYAAALDLWAPLAHSGVARAQNNIGACFAEGLGVERDPPHAFKIRTF